MLLNVSTIHTQYSNPWNWVSPSYFRKDLNKISLIKLQNIGIEFVYSIVEIDSKWVSPLNTSAVDVIRCPDVCAHKYFLNELMWDDEDPWNTTLPKPDILISDMALLMTLNY